VLAKQPRALMCNFPLSPTIGRNQKGKTLSKVGKLVQLNRSTKEHANRNKTDQQPPLIAVILSI
jgi:hypothetical protein